MCVKIPELGHVLLHPVLVLQAQPVLPVIQGIRLEIFVKKTKKYKK